MAIKWPLANGNWSNAANWNDGTLPDVGDDVYADGKTVTIDQDVTVLSIRNDQRSGGTANGTFIALDGITINANLNRASVTLLTYSGSGVLNINGNFTTSASATSQYVLLFSGSGVINIVGNIVTTLLSAGRVSVLFSGSGIINLSGNLNFSSFAGAESFILSGSGTLNFTGSVDSGVLTSSNSTGATISIGASAKLNMLGNLGNASGSTNAIISNSGYLFFEGNITAVYVSSSRPAISGNSGTSINIIKGSINCSPYGDFPIEVKRLNYFPSPNTFIIFADSSTNGQLPPASPPSTFTLYSADVVIDAPVASDVRKDVVYADGVLTGTLAVPDPSNVRKDIPTDNTVGTAELTGEDIAEGILNAIQSSENPVAERLRNVSTVQTTGDQIAGS
jgi:hypothetical protein